jgi:hypothetical protein
VPAASAKKASVPGSGTGETSATAAGAESASLGKEKRFDPTVRLLPRSIESDESVLRLSELIVAPSPNELSDVKTEVPISQSPPSVDVEFSLLGAQVLESTNVPDVTKVPPV